jgi:hypothetical protein
MARRNGQILRESIPATSTGFWQRSIQNHCVPHSQILRYPHSGFSWASRRTSALMFLPVAGRPVLPRLDRAAQRRRARSRCQRRIVSGVTSSRRPWRRAFGIALSRVASRARSAQFRVRANRLPLLQDCELVAQDQDLRGFPCLLTLGQPQPRG